jgi:integrase
VQSGLEEQRRHGSFSAHVPARRQRPEDVQVVSVGADHVRNLIEACEDMQKLICVTSAAYLGARGAALAGIRRGDVDLVQRTVRLIEKGGKAGVKPLAREYQDLLLVAERRGLSKSPADYLIPNRRAASVRRDERSDKIVWETIKGVARRAGVRPTFTPSVQPSRSPSTRRTPISCSR